MSNHIEGNTYLAQHKNVASSTRAIPESDSQYEDTDQNSNTASAKLRDSRNNTARTGPRKTNGLDDGDQRLKEKYEEEHHEVEAGIVLERLVRRAVPESKQTKSSTLTHYQFILHTYQHRNEAGVKSTA